MEVGSGGGAEGAVAGQGAPPDLRVDVEVGVGQAGQQRLEAAGLAAGGVVDGDPGAVLVVGLGVVDDAAQPVAQRGGIAAPAVVGLVGEQPGGVACRRRQRGEAGLGGRVAFGVDDMHVEAAGEGGLGEAQQRFGLAGAGQAEDHGSEAEHAGGKGAPLPRFPLG
jgi:hypothetical protein